MIAAIELLLLVALGADIFRWFWRRWRSMPLPRRNMARATGGAFLLAALAVLTGRGMIPAGCRYIAAGIAALALLWIVVGVRGAHGATYDFMSAFWWAVLAAGCVSLLIAHANGAVSLATISFWGWWLWEWWLRESPL